MKCDCGFRGNADKLAAHFVAPSQHDYLHWDRGGRRAACGLLWSDDHDTGGAQTYSFREFLKEDPPTVELCERCVELFVDAALGGSRPRAAKGVRT